MSETGTVHTVTECISLDTFRRDCTDLIQSGFSPEEQAELEKRPDQTKAGILAVKKALAKLYTELFNAHDITEHSFIVLHQKNGAPYIKKFPEIPSDYKQYTKKDFHISISHNRAHTYGLAAIREKQHE